MKSCCRYNSKLKHEFDFDELIIIYENNLPELAAFCMNHACQRVILDIKPDEVEKFEEEGIIMLGTLANSKYFLNNISVRFPDKPYLKPKTLEILTKLKIPFFYNTLINNFDVLYWMMNGNPFPPSEVYIVDSLGFSLKDVNYVCGNRDYQRPHDVKIRVLPNVAQSTSPLEPGLTCFWIRPEDMMAYDSLVDVMEFYQYKITDPRFSQTDPDLLYKIYFEDGEWTGEISEIIEFFTYNEYQNPIDNTFLDGTFTAHRLSCDKKCTKGHHCGFCSQHAELAEILSKNGMVPIQEKDR